MKIDWKTVAQSDGYKALKAQYIRDVKDAARDIERGRRPMRDKEEFRRLFIKLIGRATNNSLRTGIPIEDILAHWAKKCGNTWWLNGYYFVTKLPSGKPRNVHYRNAITTVRTDHWCRKEPKRKLLRIRELKTSWAKEARKKAGKKPRWSMEQKRRQKEYLKARKEVYGE